MGRKRKISDGVIVTVYLPKDLYLFLLATANKHGRSLSEYVREVLSGIMTQTKIMNGGCTIDLSRVKKELIVEEVYEKIENLRKLMDRLENVSPSEKNTLKYYELKQTVRRLAMELIDYVNKNCIDDKKLLDEASNILRRLNSKK
jgi:anaerobic ribonucleoside-triphosphate reductase